MTSRLTPSAPAAAGSDESSGNRGFDQWIESLHTSSQPPAESRQERQRQRDLELDEDTVIALRELDRGIRQDVDRRMTAAELRRQEDQARGEMWNTFQTRYPEFAGMDDFVASAYSAVTNGRTAVPPTAELRDELMQRVYDRAVAQRDRLLQNGGFEIVDEEGEVTRTAGVEGGTQPEPASGDRPSQAPTQDDHTLGSTLVMMQGETEFFPEMSEADALANYGRKSSHLRA